MKKVLSMLLLGAMLAGALVSCGEGGEGSSTTTTSGSTSSGTTTTTRVQTTPPIRTTVYDPRTETEVPLADLEVIEWMDSHVLLNDLVNIDSMFCSPGVGLFADGHIENLFDSVYSEADWTAAQVPKHEAFVKDENGQLTDEPLYELDTDGNPVLDEEGNPVRVLWSDLEKADMTPLDPTTGLPLTVTNDDGTVSIVTWRMLGKVGFSGNTLGIFWAMDEAVTVGSYVIYTGNDNASYPGRNPQGWTLFATNNADLIVPPADMDPLTKMSTQTTDADTLLEAGWVELDYVYSGEMADANFLPFGYKIDEANQGEYQYYCWYIDFGGSVDNLMQFTGLKLFSPETVAE